jgi:hypothetical protein
MKKLFLTFALSCSLTAYSDYETSVLKYASDTSGIPPYEISQYVKFGLISRAPQAPEGFSDADLAAASAAAGVDIAQFNVVGITEWNLNIPRPTQEQLDAVVDEGLVFLSASQLKQVDGVWVRKSAEELEAERQSQKPLEQRQYENAFFALTEQVLTLSSDPRVGQTPPVKLGFDELNALLESLFDSDMATATKFSIKLLSIDSALKRYNTLWWDDAITHEIPEE